MTKNHNEIRDRGYKMQRQFDERGTSYASPAARGTRVQVIQADYFKRELPAGATGTIVELTNAGFRGIEAGVRMDLDGEFAIINLGNLDLIAIL